jgi:prophage antirepressor-like protein
MNNLQRVFNYQERQVRTIIKDGEPWFVATDICNILEIGNTTDAVSRLDADEKGLDSTDTLGGKQYLVLVNEPGIYSLILKSRKKKAKPFQRWITHEVLPTIRRTGAYEVKTVESRDTVALQVARQLLIAVEANTERIDTAETRIETLEVKVEKEIIVNSRQATMIRFAVATKIRGLLPDDYKSRSKQYFSWLYREIYARFAVPSYRDIPRKELNAVLELIKEWEPVQAA